MNKRNYTYDFLRVVCMIWIVCIWHLTDYYKDTPFFHIIHDSKLSYVVYIALAAFTFLSGLFLGKYEIKNLNDVIYFFKRRFLRVYFLLLIALVTLFITPHPILGDVYIKDANSLLYSIIGLSMIMPPAPATLWYMEMLLLFYACTPMLLWLRRKKAGMLVIFSFLFAMIAFRGGVR